MTLDYLLIQGYFKEIDVGAIYITIWNHAGYDHMSSRVEARFRST